MIRSVPIYDYRCDSCGHAFSAVRSYSDGPVEVCPNCGKRPRKLLVAPAVVFKGSGWYKTDSRGAAPSGGTSDTKLGSRSESKSESKGESKSESKGESKSESKAESKPAGDPSPKSEATS